MSALDDAIAAALAASRDTHTAQAGRTAWAKTAAYLQTLKPAPPPPPPPPSSSVPHGVFSGLPTTDYSAAWDQITAVVPFTALYSSAVPSYVQHAGHCWVNLPAGWGDRQAKSYAVSVWSSVPSNVLAFYIADDTDIDQGKGAAWLKARSDLIHAACPGSITLATHYSPQTIAGIVGSVDEVGVDYYPARTDGSFRLDIVKQCVAAAGSRYSGVVGVSAGGTSVRVPTATELKAQLDYWATTAARSVFVYRWDVPLIGNAALVSVLRAWA